MYGFPSVFKTRFFPIGNAKPGILSREVPHAYFMTGLLWEINKNTKLQPQLLLKYAQNTPLDIDLNLNFILMNKLNLGVSYRFGGSSVEGNGESINLLFGIQASEQLLLGFSYDITLTELKDYSSGSIEAMIRYSFGPRKTEDQEVEGDYLNPRFF